MNFDENSSLYKSCSSLGSLHFIFHMDSLVEMNSYSSDAHHTKGGHSVPVNQLRIPLFCIWIFLVEMNSYSSRLPVNMKCLHCVPSCLVTSAPV